MPRFELDFTIYMNNTNPFLAAFLLQLNLLKIKPILICPLNRKDLYINQLKGKTGIYCLFNTENGNFYIGSSTNLARRIADYLGKSKLAAMVLKNMNIAKALLKYGTSPFILIVIEFTPIDLLAIRETFFITVLKPVYNVLKEAYSSIGNTHSFETLIKLMSVNSLSPLYIYNSFKTLLVVFPSVKTLADLIQANSVAITNCIADGSLFRGEWYFSRTPFLNTDVPLIPNFATVLSDHLANKHTLLEDMIKNIKIKKVIFLYDENKKLLKIYDGVMKARDDLNMCHTTIKRFALTNKPFRGYIFSYHRLL